MFAIEKILFFETTQQFRDWLSQHGDTEKELWVGFRKVGTGIPGMRYPEAVDQALCFGWIDGLKKTVDERNYCLRFTPRKPDSNWSQVNINKMEQLIQSGLVTAKGLKLYQNRKIKTDEFSYENKPQALPEEMQAHFINEFPVAWQFFDKLPPSHKRTYYHWILSAKQVTTRQRRLQKVIENCIQQKRMF